MKQTKYIFATNQFLKKDNKRLLYNPTFFRGVSSAGRAPDF